MLLKAMLAPFVTSNSQLLRCIRTNASNTGRLISKATRKVRFKLAASFWSRRSVRCRRHDVKRISNAILRGRIPIASVYSTELYNRFPSVQFSTILPELRVKALTRTQLNFIASATLFDRWRLTAEDYPLDLSELERRLGNGLAEPPVITVVIPVYNNGEHLLGKCLSSLATNHLFSKMQIVIVDDCSDERRTREILSSLERKYQNIEVVSLADGPSGSASVPRNVGMALAKAPWTTFLDPDNSICARGFDRLFNHVNGRQQEIDFVSGYQVKVSETPGITALNARRGVEIYPNPLDSLLRRSFFPTVSSQAALISTSLLRESQIRFIDRATGQDTLFGWELLAVSKGTMFVDDAWLLYFAERRGSVSNAPEEEFLARLYQRDFSLAKFACKYGLGEALATSGRLPDIGRYEVSGAAGKALAMKLKETYREHLGIELESYASPTI